MKYNQQGLRKKVLGGIKVWGMRTLESSFDANVDEKIEFFFIILHVYNLILVNKQRFHYVFYSLLLLQTHRVCVKGHQNKPQT